MLLVLFICCIISSNCFKFEDGFNSQYILQSSFLRKNPVLFTPLVGNSHPPCNVSGNTGVCLFTWECVTAGGTPLGTCEAEGLYGSCCFTPSLISALTRVKVDKEGALKPVSYGTHTCGIRSKLFERRGHIFYGEDAYFGEFPWQVSIRRVSLLNQTIQWCGGALLNNEWIITAAHCFYRVTSSNIIARLGALDFKNPNKKFPFVERRIKDNIWHPEYVKQKGKISGYDIALLRMESPVRFQPHISPICLPGEGSVVWGAKALTTGWGKTESEKGSPKLKKITVPILNNTECEKLFSAAYYVTKLNPNVMCAGYSYGRLDACQGDSGGPLQLRGKDGRFFIVGLVSTGVGCAKPNFPGVYIRTRPFLHWIMETMSANGFS